MALKHPQLYQCFNAKVIEGLIKCSKGHQLHFAGEDIPYSELESGKALVYKTCQGCPDFDYMGPELLKKDKGWV